MLMASRVAGWAPEIGRAFARKGGLALMLGLLTSGCSLLLDLQANPCETTADCTKLGPEFANTVCTSQNVCSAPGQTTHVTGECDHNTDCIAAHDDEPYICREHKCVALNSEDCKGLPVGDFTDDNAFIVGFMAEYTGAGVGFKHEHGVSLAFNELDQLVAGIPGRDGARRPLVFVPCDEIANPVRAATHLIDDVGVTAILGPAHSSNVLEIVSKKTVKDKVLVLSAISSAPDLTDYPDDGLLWRADPSDAFQISALALELEQLEADVRKARGLQPTDKIKVAVAYRNDTWGQSMFGKLQKVLKFNGTDISGNGASYMGAEYDPVGDVSGLVGQAVAFKPDIFIPLGFLEVISKIMLGVESGWPTDAGAPPRPTWLLSEGSKLPPLIAGVGTDDALRVRIRGTSSTDPHGTPTFDSFQVRFKNKFGSEPQDNEWYFYDAAYALAYAAVGAGQVLSGPNLVLGMGKLSSGFAISSGPDDAPKAMSILASSSQASIDMVGASGPLDFDPITGEPSSNVDIWCVGRDADDKAVFRQSGQHYDAMTNTLVGTYDCP
jgi:branched-chain amino acid transport system substrate-binding protein